MAAPTGPSGSTRLTHVDESGAARMVDVGAKAATARRAVARGTVRMSPRTAAAVAAVTVDRLVVRDDQHADVASGELKVVIDKTFPLSEAAEAHRYIESRQAVGRVLLIP